MARSRFCADSKTGLGQTVIAGNRLINFTPDLAFWHEYRAFPGHGRHAVSFFAAFFRAGLTVSPARYASALRLPSGLPLLHLRWLYNLFLLTFSRTCGLRPSQSQGHANFEITLPFFCLPFLRFFLEGFK
ncbi:hypothetical protein O5699_01125 [Escherichia coli]|nr:hypothetical protein [Escherichia coli]